MNIERLHVTKTSIKVRLSNTQFILFQNNFLYLEILPTHRFTSHDPVHVTFAHKHIFLALSSHHSRNMSAKDVAGRVIGSHPRRPYSHVPAHRCKKPPSLCHILEGVSHTSETPWSVHLAYIKGAKVRPCQLPLQGTIWPRTNEIACSTRRSHSDDEALRIGFQSAFAHKRHPVTCTLNKTGKCLRWSLFRRSSSLELYSVAFPARQRWRFS